MFQVELLVGQGGKLGQLAAEHADREGIDHRLGPPAHFRAGMPANAFQRLDRRQTQFI